MDAAPSVGLNPAPLNYVEMQGPVKIDPGLTVSAQAGATLTAASVRLLGYQPGDDQLGATVPNGLAEWWDSRNGVLTLTGAASASTYQAVLRSVTFADFRGDPRTSPRVAEFTLTDSTSTCQAAGRSIAIIAINNPPAVLTPPAQTIAAGATLTFSTSFGNLIAIGDVDANGAAEQVTLTASHGRLTVASTAGLSFRSGAGAGDATMTFTGTLDRIDAALNGLTFTPDAYFAGAATLLVSADDLGNTGLGGPQIVNALVPITVTGSIAHTPTVTDAWTQENAQTKDGVFVAPNVADAQGYFKISGIVGGMLFLSDGTTPVADGQFIPFAAGEAGLKFTPAAISAAAGGFDVQAALAPTDAALAGGIVRATVTVIATVPQPPPAPPPPPPIVGHPTFGGTPIPSPVGPLTGKARLFVTLGAPPDTGSKRPTAAPSPPRVTNSDSNGSPVGEPSDVGAAAETTVGTADATISVQKLPAVFYTPPVRRPDGSPVMSGQWAGQHAWGRRFSIVAARLTSAVRPTDSEKDVDPGSEMFALVQRGYAPAANPHGRVSFVPGTMPDNERDAEATTWNAGLWRELDALHQHVTSDRSLRVWAGTASVLSVGASVTWLLWTSRVGSLLSGLLSAIPAWRVVDPLPLLDHLGQSAAMLKRNADDGMGKALP